MRLFQNSAIYPAYAPRLQALVRSERTFAGHIRRFLADRFGAPHFLLPVLEGHVDAFFANGNDVPSQRLWAAEQGMPENTSLRAILLSQLEAHRTEVFYNLDPIRYDSSFLRELPGCVRHSIAWRAAPSPNADLGGYDRIVCNFPSILDSYRRAGWQAAYFAPAHDPAMDRYAEQGGRAVDVLFVGSYSRHHRRRAALLEDVARLQSECRVVMHLDRSSLTRLAESAMGRLLPLGKHRRPPAISGISRDPIFGLNLYEALSRARIVVNGAIDMAAEDRGNMRCFEALGCGCLLLSDSGRYPEGMDPGRTILTYDDPVQAVAQIREYLGAPDRLAEIAAAGRAMVRQQYSKQAQWEAFQALVH